MRTSLNRKRNKQPACHLCGEPLETAATAQNPSATIKANHFARCSSCMVLFVIGVDLQPSPDLSCDMAAFDTAMNANSEIEEWARKTLEIGRIRRVAEIKADCAVARELLITCNSPDLIDDLATLDAYAAGFNETGITSAPHDIRLRASSILAKMDRQTRR